MRLDETTLNARYEKMREIVSSLESVAVAFSAGVDSTFVLKVALDVLGPGNVVAVTADSESLARSELDQTRRLTESLGAEHVVLRTEELADESYRSNPQNRCYYCKSEMYDRMQGFIEQRGLRHIVAGVNADDFGDWRPGISAGNERAVCCPVADAGLTKADVRELSRRLGLPTSEKPASPCLSSRVQYGEEITAEKLRMIETCEAFLHELGFGECRVRHHGNLARIEVPADKLEQVSTPETRRLIVERFREAGYSYVTLDLQGFRSGSMNEVIAFGKRQPAL